MRSREAIMEDLNEADRDANYVRKEDLNLVVELLLDIRDLLKTQNVITSDEEMPQPILYEREDSQTT